MQGSGTGPPYRHGNIVGLVGVRRSGKTFLLFDTVQRLATQGVNRQCILYLNVEDDRLWANFSFMSTNRVWNRGYREHWPRGGILSDERILLKVPAPKVNTWLWYID